LILRLEVTPLTPMRLNVPTRSDLYISPLTHNDWMAVYEAVSNPNVLSRLDIPTPYDEGKARDFCSKADSARYSWNGEQLPVVFAVRDSQKGDMAMGCIDLRLSDSTTPFYAIDPHFRSADGRSAEVGYWLAEGYQGHGLMSLVVQAVFQYARDVMAVDFCCAACRSNNPASAKTICNAGLTLREEENGVQYYWSV
jgi:RimJ/RimL family protein N-acetyltransferase